ncbi:serine/threonine protein kinase [Corallincola luteus]|uniref:Serine/threonine protein kinase n=1 Tax=Corallincola luteus TaxID=1775177 RepID=A0ABY2AJ90_9GAMM|nr:phosphotransferase [Corallincola luteus]TCI01788.1 serine/threonine protein kinase [Corallincola luteus]
MAEFALKHFYIAEEQSIYLLSQNDARKLKQWVQLCMRQLEQLGYQQISLIGKGAYGFVFAGTSRDGAQKVFKFSRITLPESVQARLEDEAYMQQQVVHPQVPRMLAFERVGKQSILMMQRAPGEDLEKVSLQLGPLPARWVLQIAAQLVQILNALRQLPRTQVHGDIKPSNIVFDRDSEAISLIDWGSSVFAQLESDGQPAVTDVQSLMSGDVNHSNARLGDVYFIGAEQLNGALSSPRFDEQGVASTLYALASGQSCRFGHRAIPASSLGLPQEFARTLDNLLADDEVLKRQAGDYLLQHMERMRRHYFASDTWLIEPPLVPVWLRESDEAIDTVVYSSRRSFLMADGDNRELMYMDDVQLEKYYKNYLVGMGEIEKAFIAAVSRLGQYPVVGGLALHWNEEGVAIDASLNLYDESYQRAFHAAVNTMVKLARALCHQGTFKSCMFNARNTLHIDRNHPSHPFVPLPGTSLAFEIQPAPPVNERNRHSYFEDGRDPDEQLTLPDAIIEAVEQLNQIHHTGCIIFESLDTHLRIHSYYMLLEPEKADDFTALLAAIIDAVPLIKGTGTAGYMKLPYKNTRQFERQEQQAEQFYPKDPR